MRGPDPFREGMEKIRRGMEQGVHFALMCAEIHQIDCHRAILVDRAFADSGCQVVHLLPDGKDITHKNLESQLLDLYFKGCDQCSLFDGAQARDEAELLIEAYRKRNAEIGYHLQEDDP